MFRLVHVRPARGARGFALVLALVVMAMLLLLCLSCATLLAVELRVGRGSLERAQARLNAVAAGRIALGEVQRLAGPDRRITANAAILAPEVGKAGEVRRPRLVGVWKGLTQTPGTPAGWSASNLPALAPVSAYAEDHDGAFAGWLASGRRGVAGARVPALTDGSGSAARDALAWVKSAAAVSDADWVLWSAGDEPRGAAALAGEEPRAVSAQPEVFPTGVGDAAPGAFAWAVMDENQKARVDLRDAPAAGDALTRALLSTASAARFHPAHPEDGTAGWVSRAAPATGAESSWYSLPMDAGAGAPGAGPCWLPLEPDGRTPLRALRHDFTTESVTLLTDAANGGLKRDVSLLPLMATPPVALDGPSGHIGFEGPEAAGALTPDSAGRMAWWRTAKTRDAVPRMADSPTGAFWPVWSDVREWSAFATTARVMDDAGRMRPMLYLSGGAPTLLQISNTTEAKYLAACRKPEVDRAYQSPWRQPVLYRYRLELSLHAQPDVPAPPATALPGSYRLLPKANIVVQIWNPYNVELELDPKAVYSSVTESLPFDLLITGKDLAGNPRTARMRFVNWYYSGGSFTQAGGNQTGFNAWFNYSGTLKAGAIRTYSVPMDSVVGGSAVTLAPGYYPGHYKYFGTDVANHYAATGFDGNSPLSIRIQHNNGTDNWRPPLYIAGTKSFGVPMRGGNRDGTDQNPMRILGNPQLTAQEPLRLIAEKGDNTLVIFENRLKADALTGGDAPYVAARPEDTGADAGRLIAGEPPGVFGRVWVNDGRRGAWQAFPYECVIWSRYGYADGENRHPLEVEGDTGDAGFGGTGYASTTGLGAYVYHHLPLHPPVGLLSLRHARLGGGLRPVFRPGDSENRNAWIANIHDAFGNALPAPYVPTDSVAGAPLPAAYTGDPVFTPYDMSWLMNSAVADAWFVSSLGAWDAGLAAAMFPALARSAESWYGDFLSGASRLPDRRLRPDPLSPVPEAEARAFLKGDAATDAAFRRLPATMLVAGGFNLNSTSVRAWRAFLASTHADAGPGEAAGVPVRAPGPNAPVVVPRAPGTAVVTTHTVPAAAPTASPAADADGRVNGGRALAEAELDRLARAIVAEVKRRGPFLSVSEFLNRRLESGECGYKGATQAAIDAAGLNAHLAATGRALTPAAPARGDLNPALNPDFAKVYTHAGVNRPGWLSQADLLAPLASAMTVRGDTFLVRVSATAPGGGARASLELTLRRTYAYVDTREGAGDAEDAEYLALTGVANRAFGRRVVVVGARWLEPETL